MHSRTDRRRNSGRRESVDRTTENIQPDFQAMVQRRGKSSPAVLRNTASRQPPVECKVIEAFKGCPSASDIPLEIESNFNTRQMII